MIKKIAVPNSFINMTCCVLGEEFLKFNSLEDYFRDFFIGESDDYKKTIYNFVDKILKMNLSDDELLEIWRTGTPTDIFPGPGTRFALELIRENCSN